MLGCPFLDLEAMYEQIRINHNLVVVAEDSVSMSATNTARSRLPCWKG